MDAAARPLTILIAALGGEGGAVLADWLRDAAITAGYPIQSTSIPGVAQRTGATTYYLELYPVCTAELDGTTPVFALTPTPDGVDLMVASELVEAGRAMQNGYVTARTTLIAATHRVYATSEKMQIGDGRFDASRILAAGPQLARRAAFIDMAALAQSCGTVISAVMFGAIAGSRVLPLTRNDCESAIRAGGVGVEGSLKGFDAGYSAVDVREDNVNGSQQPAQRARGDAPQPADATALSQSPATLPAGFEQRIREGIAGPAQHIVREGVRRVLDYQDADYATRYLDRIATIAHAADPRVVSETARFLALWMTYEDIIRVADLKTRQARFDRVRTEVGAQSGEPVRVVEYLRPGVREICDVLPPSVARQLLARAPGDGAGQWGNGMHVSTSSISGFVLLRMLASLRRFRPRSSRFIREQRLIDEWLAAIRSALAAADDALALEIALAARLIKGYGDTHERSAANFARVIAVAGDATIAPAERAVSVRTAREAALGDPDANRSTPSAVHAVKFVKKRR